MTLGHVRAGACAAALALLAAPGAAALEALDGRVQVHGFSEVQVRALDREFKEELDLAQWYNVLNVELELDFAPDGIGPIDLFQAFIRAEVRYDCVYTRGCGTMRSADTFGNRAQRLPNRLSDASDPDYSGVIPALNDNSDLTRGTLASGQKPVGTPLGADQPRHPRPEPARLEPFRDASGEIIKDSGIAGFDTLFDLKGADNLPRTGDDPALYTFGPVLDYRLALIHVRDQGAGGTTVLGPWLPKNEIQSNAMLLDRANPFRGRLTPTGGQRFHEADVSLGATDPFNTRTYTDPLDSRLLDILANPGFRPQVPGGPLVVPIKEFFAARTNTFPTLVPKGLDVDPFGGSSPELFGGDYSGVIPCLDPKPTSPPTQQQRNGTNDFRFCIPDGAFVDPTLNPADPANLFAPGTGTNIRITGGAGELPMRPAPDISNLDRTTNRDLQLAQGLYLPSVGLRRELSQGNLNDIDFNFTQSERALNRGQSQQDDKELKEAYLDLEFLDSRLWARLGKQNIVWGKTELFRTTDQFNPQDFALASLPSLEESRIALWSARFVYSLYDIGDFEDVRLEFAVNWDQYQPADIGACGEPFTPNIVCNVTFGIAAHSVLGVGIAGIDRPPDPWDNPSKGAEIGGRIEWRWDRFSFALADFFGYDDFPYPDEIFTYERNVDPVTGRPRVAESRAPCGAGFATVAPRARQGMTLAGIGTDPACLKGGGTPGFAGENRFRQAPDVDGDGRPDPQFIRDLNGDNVRESLDVNGDLVSDDGLLYGYGGLPGASPENALQHHSANQQIFAVLCSNTVGIAASLDAGACAFNIFASSARLIALFDDLFFSEVIASILAGEQDGQVGSLMDTIQANQTGQFANLVPTRNLNRDAFTFGAGDGVATYTASAFNSVSRPPCSATVTQNCSLPGGLSAVTQEPWDFLSPDSTLSGAQRALLGCGPFLGTRCDTSNQQFLPLSLGGGRLFGFGGGFDALNTEASALVQSWPGFEGTNSVGMNGYAGGLWTSTDRALVQPGTAGFDGGPVCTRYVGGSLVVLPGCRGIATPGDLRAAGLSADPFAGSTSTQVRVVFQQGYDPTIDGCVVNPSGIGGRALVPVYVDGSPVANYASHCTFSTTRTGNQETVATVVNGAQTLYHPTAGCFADPTGADNGRPCPLFSRNFDQEFLGLDPSGRRAQIFQSEMAALSWNFLMLLVITSCNQVNDDNSVERDCYDATVEPGPDGAVGTADDFHRAWRKNWCGFAAPHQCRNAKGFLSVAGVQSNQVRAAGNGRFGRRTFVWDGGQEVVLRYERRNVLGFSADFAEDRTKTNWGAEFTWIQGLPFIDLDEEDNISRQDTLNLTVSVDRPTFINFLNANRTFFFNSQWFFQYQTGYKESFAFNGPFNVLFTFAVMTGYYQDRLMPQLITVYDFNSRSGAFLPSVQYRFTDTLSVQWGLLIFIGRTQLKQMPLSAIGPPANRGDPNAYKAPVDNILSGVRDRDEVFMRLRWTF